VSWPEKRHGYAAPRDRCSDLRRRTDLPPNLSRAMADTDGSAIFPPTIRTMVIPDSGYASQ